MIVGVITVRVLVECIRDFKSGAVVEEPNTDK